MGFKITVRGFVGLVFLVAALASGANAAMAENYAQMRGSTPAGLNADGLRGLNGDGLRLQAIARALQNRPAASYYTPQALKAEGLRWQRLAGIYAQPQIVRNGGFDWSDAGIGAVGGLGFAMVGGALLLGARRMRRTRVAV
jgi:hypothetical protein